MSIIKQNCLHCNKEFNARSQDVNRGYGKFCSQSCSSIFNRSQEPKPQHNVACAFCQKTFYKNVSKQAESKSGLYFCSRKHKDAAQKIGGIKSIMPPHYGIVSENTYRRIAFTVKPKQCERCGYNTNESAIIVHHIDRNRENNNISNLEVLCANCHAIEHWGDNAGGPPGLPSPSFTVQA